MLKNIPEYIPKDMLNKIPKKMLYKILEIY